MKRTFRIFLFAAILAAFLMGCSPLLPVSPSGETAVPSEPSAPPATTAPTEEPAPTFDDSVLGEAYTNEGTFTDAWGSEWSYSLHLPRLLLDTPAAEELNSKIHRDLFGFVTAMGDGHRAEYARRAVRRPLGAGLDGQHRFAGRHRRIRRGDLALLHLPLRLCQQHRA